MDPRVAHELIAIALTVAQRIGGGGASRPKRTRRKLADGGASGDAPTPDAYLDAFEHLNAPTSADAIRRGVPRPESDALLKYGDIDLVPAFHRWPEAALTGLENLSGAALAFPPTAAAAGPVEYGLGALLQAPRAAFGALSRSSADIGPVLPRSGPAVDDALTLARKYTSGSGQDLAALRSEVDDLAAKGKSFGIDREPFPDVADLSPTEERNILGFMRDSLARRIAARQEALDRVNAAAPGTSVPSIDGITPIRERNQIIDALNANPFVQSIAGRRGFPTKEDQLDLANYYFDQMGGRLSEPGPWGRDTNSEVARILQQAYNRQNMPQGPAANLPDVPSIMRGYKNAASDAAAAQREANQLRNSLNFRERQLRNLRNKPPGGSDGGAP